MTCSVEMEHPRRFGPWSNGWLGRLAGLYGRRGTVSKLPRLDLETLPDQMKRDLGFLDGRTPRRECDF